MICRYHGEQRRPTRSGGCPDCARGVVRDNVHPYIRQLAERDLRAPRKRSEARLATRRLRRTCPFGASLKEWARAQDAGAGWFARKRGAA